MGSDVNRSARIGFVAVLLVAVACGDQSGSDTSVADVPDASTTTAAAATSATDQSTTTTTLAPGPLRGFSISPPNTSADGFTEFLARVEASSTLLEWVGDGLEWEEGGTPDVTVALAEQAGVEPITIGGWTRTEDGSLLRPLDQATTERYVEAARSYAARHSPSYMGFGVEIDTHWREFPDQWAASTALFVAVADAIHEASPATRVLVAFQLERLRGLQGGLFGGENSDDLAAWHLLDDFPDADIIAFTTYPSLVFETPADMPDDYYTSIADHTDTPVAFTEMGWQAGGDFGAWSGTEEKQAAFIERFPQLIDGLDVAFYTWSYLYDQPIPGTFATMALITTDGTERLGWRAWLDVG